MAESTVIVINEEFAVGRALNCMDSTKHLSKRKRAAASLDEPENLEKRDAFVERLSSEIETLFRFFNEVSDGDFAFDFWRRGEHGFDINSSIACLMEESSKPLSKLVEDIYNMLNGKGMNVGLTMAFLKTSVLKIGQRSSYGRTDPDADLLEDENQSNLWCWETRDLKLMPKPIRMDLKIRRTCRKKIHDRITAVYGVLTTLENFSGDHNVTFYLTKAEEKLSKVLNETDIRSLKADMNEKRLQEEERVLLNRLEKNKREAQKEEIKQMEKDKREAQKEEIKLQREIQREKLEKERRLKHLQEEENKEKKRKEREEKEMKKLLRRQQEEAEREQRQREKEGDDIKKQMAIQKQASIMDRFLKRSKNISTCNIEPSLSNVEFNKFILNEKEMGESVSQAMDLILFQKDGHNIDEIIREHMSEWHRLGSSHSCRNKHWGMRQKPKSHLFNNIKLTQQVDNDEFEVCEVHDDNNEKCEISVDVNIIQLKKCNQKRQLFQFDKSHRPAFYGVWHKMSLVVGPRHPFRKDPELDYEIDSDDEWEEEDPGESLSDCERDGDEECEEGMSKVEEEEESEDGFFVPDGYLSETEGVEADEIECSPSEPDDIPESCNREQWIDVDELNSLYKQQKLLHNFTENALRKNRPLIVLNLMHEKAWSASNDPTDVLKVEQTCLHALKMIPFPNRAPIEPCLEEDNDGDRNTGVVDTQASISNPTAPVVKPDLPKIVSVIQSNPKGMGKVVENLHQEFPGMPKSELRRKVREISNFVDNRWQVRKDILEKVGTPVVTPEKGNGGTRSITSFFSKRCLPPADKDDCGAAAPLLPPPL